LYKRVSQKSAITRTKRLMKKLIDTGSIIFHQCRAPRRSFVTITESGANRLGCYHVRDISLNKDQMPQDKLFCNSSVNPSSSHSAMYNMFPSDINLDSGESGVRYTCEITLVFSYSL
jgi:hypothetical protein